MDTNSAAKNNTLFRNAFLAGAASASLLWTLAASTWRRFQRAHVAIPDQHQKHAKPISNQHEDGMETAPDQTQDDHDQVQQNKSQPKYPWKIDEATQYHQLLELRTSLIEHSRRTSLLLLDKILSGISRSQSKLFIGELPSKKRIRWPWESLRKKNIAKIEANDESDGGHLDKQRAESNNQDYHTNENCDESNGEEVGYDVNYVRTDDGSPRRPSSEGNRSNISPEEAKDICIGSIFGLDVGGTLSKLVYFEKKKENDNGDYWNSNIGHSATSKKSYRRARSELNTLLSDDYLSKNVRERTASSNIDYATGIDYGMPNVSDDVEERTKRRSTGNLLSPREHEAIFEDDVRIGGQQTPSSKTRLTPDTKMKRSYSLFDVTSKKVKREQALNRFYAFAQNLDDSEVRDKNLSFYSRALGGEFHFIQFETRHLPQAMDLIRVNDLHLNISKMGATGGGAHKYSDKWEQMLGIEIAKQDELDSLVAGMQFILSDVVGECYTFKPKENLASQQSSDSTSINESRSSQTHAPQRESQETKNRNGINIPKSKKNKALDQYWWSRKVKREFVAKSDFYPYLLVMIGTGVSVVRVDGPRKHERISGSTIGGGTYWGLCRLLTDVEDFESILNLAERGDPSKVDMMVGDIYGKESGALEKLGLSAHLVASSFGKLVAKQDPAAGLKQEDLARALLLMVTNNIGQVAYLNAQLHNTKRIYFVGNFLRHNSISQQRLAYAINYWSRGKMEALFLEHEGYFGALGSFLLHQGICADKDGNLAQSKAEPLLRTRQPKPVMKKRSMSF